MLSAHSHCYYYDIRWIFLFLINFLVRPELYLFFSDDTTTTTTTVTASPPSLLTATLLSLVLLLFLSASLKTCFSLEENGSIFIRLMVSCQGGWSLPLTCTFIFSLLCPTPVFLYIYLILLFLLSLQHCLLCCRQYPSLNFNVLPMVNSSLLTSSPLPTQASFFYFYDIRWILLIVINCFLRPYFSIFFSNHINTYPQNPLKAFLLIALILIIFLFVSLHMCLTVSEDSDSMLYILVRINYRKGWSFLLAGALMFSLLCPTLVFLYLYPCVLLLSLWPSFFRNFLYKSVIRLQQGLATLLAYIAPTNTLQDEDDPAAAFA